MAQAIGMSDEVRELRARMKDFIDNVVFKAEPELERLAEHGFHPDTGLPLELYEAAEARGDDTSRGVPRPGRRGQPARDRARWPTCKAEAKERGLWALGHPKEIGGGGLPFMDFVYLNEIIGRSEYGQVAVGSATHAGLDHAAPLRQPRAARALPQAARGRRRLPVGRAHRARGRRQRPDADADDAPTSTATSG